MHRLRQAHSQLFVPHTVATSTYPKIQLATATGNWQVKSQRGCSLGSEWTKVNDFGTNNVTRISFFVCLSHGNKRQAVRASPEGRQAKRQIETQRQILRERERERGKREAASQCLTAQAQQPCRCSRQQMHSNNEHLRNLNERAPGSGCLCVGSTRASFECATSCCGM